MHFSEWSNFVCITMLIISISVCCRNRYTIRYCNENQLVRGPPIRNRKHTTRKKNFSSYIEGPEKCRLDIKSDAHGMFLKKIMSSNFHIDRLHKSAFDVVLCKYVLSPINNHFKQRKPGWTSGWFLLFNDFNTYCISFCWRK